jgi:hypothetical protein
MLHGRFHRFLSSFARVPVFTSIVRRYKPLFSIKDAYDGLGLPERAKLANLAPSQQAFLVFVQEETKYRSAPSVDLAESRTFSSDDISVKIS